MKENMYQALRKKIKTKKARLAVIGLGYVGLPLAVEFAVRGYHVCGVDVDDDRVHKVRNLIPYILDVKMSELTSVVKKKRLTATTDFSALAQADVIFICVPTPLKTKYSPNISYILSAVKEIRKNLRRGQLIILESTTYPETTEKVILPVLESGGMRHAKDFYLAFSPERIDPGNEKFPFKKITKVIGGISREAAELTAALYRTVIANVHLVSNCRTAETVKLFENTFRIVNIALVDEMAMMAHKMGIDMWEVIDAAKTKPFGFMPFYPGPGVGGHCIPKDPLYLYWKAKHYGFASRMIKTASDIINYMPQYVVDRVEAALAGRGATPHAAHILVIGATYKKDVKDLRKSPALDIIGILQKRGIAVHYHDPLIPYLKIDHLDYKSVDVNAKSLSKYDCVLIATDHSCLDYAFIRKHARLIFDARNVYKGVRDEKVMKI